MALLFSSFCCVAVFFLFFRFFSCFFLRLVHDCTVNRYLAATLKRATTRILLIGRFVYEERKKKRKRKKERKEEEEEKGEAVG